ncbi:hypothetical protein BP6252_00211 [Coleophoma cylindrospora]|uniref:FAD/NAD(P)-binding domain-containing protein n=1 Tax=Coleophoma cylindrospora TaxID=1849047 RepID=A0A3D8SPD0_9HELO|nr:hypothetical protein BP6252_00211 [Coleophoma cylindrospora]
MSKKSVVIIGSGWAGATLSTSLDESKYSITVVSPEVTTPYTPLLASAACGLYDFNLVESPIRHTKKDIKFINAAVQQIDFKSKKCYCKPAFKDIAVTEFALDYDIIVLSPGSTNNTFGTPGVAENAQFVRNAQHARKVAGIVQDCFEKASIPGLSEQQQRDLLHFVIVGGGPTGVELSSEMSDLFDGDYAKLYPHLKGKPSIAIHDIAPNVLSSFDTKLRDYAITRFKKHHVEVLTGSHIQSIEADCINTKENGRIPCGLVIWATGNKSTALVDSLPVKKTSKQQRVLTDNFLRVFSADSEMMPDVFALGDAADIENASLPTTAEVACQKANYLAKCLNRGFEEPFQYRQTSIVAYLGQNDGVIMGKRNYSGAQAWLAWRSKNFLWIRTWRQRILLVIEWVLVFFFGRPNAPR